MFNFLKKNKDNEIHCRITSNVENLTSTKN